MASRSLFVTQGGAVINGLKETMAKLQNTMHKIEYRSVDGMVAWLEYVREDMDRVYPLIPMDTGDLADSWYIYVQSMPMFHAVEAGFTVHHAPYVHENMEPTVNWTRPFSGPKFFEKSIQRNQKLLTSSIAANANVELINPITPAMPTKQGYRAGSVVDIML